MKKSSILTIIGLGVALFSLVLYLSHVRIERQNDASEIRKQYHALQIAFIRGDFTNALETYFTPTYRNTMSGVFDRYVSDYGWIITNKEHALHPNAYVEFRGNVALLFPTRSDDGPDLCFELQKQDGRWLFDGKIIATVD